MAARIAGNLTLFGHCRCGRRSRTKTMKRGITLARFYLERGASAIQFRGSCRSYAGTGTARLDRDPAASPMANAVGQWLLAMLSDCGPCKFRRMPAAEVRVRVQFARQLPAWRTIRAAGRGPTKVGSTLHRSRPFSDLSQLVVGLSHTGLRHFYSLQNRATPRILPCLSQVSQVSRVFSALEIALQSPVCRNVAGFFTLPVSKAICVF